MRSKYTDAAADTMQPEIAAVNPSGVLRIGCSSPSSSAIPSYVADRLCRMPGPALARHLVNARGKLIRGGASFSELSVVESETGSWTMATPNISSARAIHLRADSLLRRSKTLKSAVGRILN